MPKHFTHVTVRAIVWKERIEKGSRCSKQKKTKRTKGFMLILMGEKRRESEDWIFFKDT